MKRNLIHETADMRAPESVLRVLHRLCADPLNAVFVISGMSPDGKLPEIVEISSHPWFIGVQFHPELKSKPFQPHPLFANFVKAALRQSRLV